MINLNKVSTSISISQFSLATREVLSALKAAYEDAVNTAYYLDRWADNSPEYVEVIRLARAIEALEGRGVEC